MQNYKSNADEETYQYNQKIFDEHNQEQCEMDRLKAKEEYQNKFKRIDDLEQELEQIRSDLR